MFFQELTDRLEGMKVAHQDEKQDYERQLAELRAEYTKTKDELDGEIMVRFNPTPVRGGVYHHPTEKWQLLLKIVIRKSPNFLTFPMYL